MRLCCAQRAPGVQRRTGHQNAVWPARNVWNHEDPGEALSAKWQKMWKPVVCASRACAPLAVLLRQRIRCVICSADATFFDSHVSAGLVCALEPIGLMRRVGLGETLRIALMGNDERVSADTALRIGLVSEVVAADELWTRAHEIAATIATKPPSATQGTVKAYGSRWTSLPRRLGAGADLYPAGQPARKPNWPPKPTPTAMAPGASRRSADGQLPAQSTHRRRAGSAAQRGCDRVRRSMELVGQVGEAARQMATQTAELAAAPQIGMLLRNRPGQVAAFLGVLLGGGTVVTINLLAATSAPGLISPPCACR